MRDERQHEFLSPPAHRPELEPKKAKDKREWENAASVESRLAEAIQQRRGDAEALTDFLRQSVPGWQQQTARVVLIRTLGAASARALCDRAFGMSAAQFQAESDAKESSAAARYDASYAASLAQVVRPLLADAAPGAAELAASVLGAVPSAVAERSIGGLDEQARDSLAGRPAAMLSGGAALARAAERHGATLYRLAEESHDHTDPDHPRVQEALRRQGEGQPLPEAIRHSMEAGFGVSFESVRIHLDSVAAAAADAIHAHAFSIGDDIFFAAGAFSPEGASGRQLLAHELTHVAQARQGRTQGEGHRVSQPEDALEREAEAMGSKVASLVASGPATMAGHEVAANGAAAASHANGNAVAAPRAEASAPTAAPASANLLSRAAAAPAAPAAAPQGQAGGAGDVDMTALMNWIALNEGKRDKMYIDTKGHPTIGVGFNLDRNGAQAAIQALGLDFAQVKAGKVALNDQQIETLFKQDAAGAVANAKSIVGASTFAGLTMGRRIVIIDMVFNMGSAGFAAFKNTIKAIQTGDYEKAATGMTNSAWYGQVGNRSKRDVAAMRSGVLSGTPPAAGAAQQPAGGQEKKPASTSGAPQPAGGANQSHGAATAKPAAKDGQWTPAPAIDAVRSGSAVIEKGDEGTSVAHVQTLLKLQADGKFGPGTETAVKQFQSRHHLTADGQVGPKTLSALEGQSPSKAAAHPAAPAAATAHPSAGAGRSTPAAKTTPTDTNHAQQAQEGEHQAAATGDVAYADIAKNFDAQIPGSAHFTWHNALYLPSWHRHCNANEVDSTILSNIQRQAKALDGVWNHFNKAIVVHCWLRPPAYNKLVGGASHSAHLQGLATDFHVEGMTAESVRQVLIADKRIYAGAGELGVSWVHLDLAHKVWFHP